MARKKVQRQEKDYSTYEWVTVEGVVLDERGDMGLVKVKTPSGYFSHSLDHMPSGNALPFMHAYKVRFFPTSRMKERDYKHAFTVIADIVNERATATLEQEKWVGNQELYREILTTLDRMKDGFLYEDGLYLKARVGKDGSPGWGTYRRYHEISHYPEYIVSDDPLAVLWKAEPFEGYKYFSEIVWVQSTMVQHETDLQESRDTL